jgi:hypothetical protein
MSITPISIQRPAGLAPVPLLRLLLAVLLLLLIMTLASRPTQNSVPVSGLSQTLPLAFVPNAGQTDAVARYLAQGMGGTLFFAADGVMLSLPIADEGQYALKLEFEGSAPATVTGASEIGGTISYFLGSDPAQWQTGLPSYRILQYEGLYPGISLQYDGVDGQLKGTYQVAAGAEPDLIRWRYHGAQSLAVTDGGALQITLPDGAGTVTEEAPVAWQTIRGTQVPVPVQYEIAPDGSIGFALPNGYDTRHPLTLDPTITYVKRIGGTVGDIGYAIAVDSSGATYLTGETKSGNYPSTPGVIQTHSGGLSDAFVTKLSPDGTTIVYSTYLGGEDDDIGFGIAIDPDGNAYVTGTTDSEMFPTTPDSFQPTISGYSDIFVAKLNPTGTAFGYATHLGGSGDEDGTPDIAVDDSGRAYVTGRTWSGSFPTQNPIQAQGGGGNSAFVTVFEPDGASLYFSTYYGGPNEENGTGIAVDNAGMIYITGHTNSSYNFPLVNAFQSIYGGPYADAFVAKMDPVVPALLYSTYLGGESTDTGDDIVVDSGGNATIVGITRSANYPTRFPVQGFGGDWDAIVTQLSPAGNTVNFSTFLGGSGRDEAEGIALDPQGYLYVSGATTSDDFPVADPVQAMRGGGTDGFAVRYFPGGTVDYATYLGGASTDHAYSITADAQQNAYVIGYTRSQDFPLGAPPPGNTWDDVFVIKLGGAPGPAPTATATGTPTNTPTPTSTGTPATSTPTSTATATPTATSVPDVIACSTTPLTIPDGMPIGITGTLTVPDTIIIGDVNVVITGTHGWVGDVVMRLSHTGSRSVFYDRPGVPDGQSGGAGCQGDDFPGIVADDEGSTGAFETACQNTNPAYLSGGHYTPNNPLSVFDGQSSAGVWSLNLSDRLSGDSGVISTWCIQLRNVDPDPTATATGEPPASPTATGTPQIPPMATNTPEVPPTVTPSPTGEPVPPTPTSTPPVPEPLIELDPPYLEQTQLFDQSVEYQVRMTNMDNAPLIWSSYTAESSCYAPSPLEWVSVAPAAGTMIPGAEVPMTITISTLAMAPGDHSGYVCILDSAGMIKPYLVMVHVLPEAGRTRLYLPLLSR